jgi:hypothetical protein
VTAPSNIDTPNWRWLAVHLALWFIFVVAFTQGFTLWQWLVAVLGDGAAGFAPLVLSAFLAACCALFLWWKIREIDWIWGLAALVVFTIGLASTDSDFPAKRVHLPEYFVLALVVYWSIRHYVSRGGAIGTAVALATMLGGLDEIIQGAMPSRTFGHSDLIANGLGALSAGFFLRAVTGKGGIWSELRAIIWPIVIVSTGYGLLLLGVNAHKGLGFPVWVYLPALASLPMLVVEAQRSSGYRGKFPVLVLMGTVCLISLFLTCGIDALDYDFR